MGEERSEAALPVAAMLERLGVDMAPTLRQVPTVPESGLAGMCLGRFQLLGELGRGGMGRVLEARDPELRRRVAVKVVIDPRGISAAQLARFVAEAQVTSQLEHPNIVPVHDIGVTPDGEVYFVMKKVAGRSLRQVLDALAEGDEATAAEWTRHRLLTAFVQVCNAVAYAHDRGVLHRDLKPDNLMLGRFGEVLVMDWGVARLLASPEEVDDASWEGADPDSLLDTGTEDGSLIGTPGHMSPEQARGELAGLDPRSDVWSLGSILYELLTGRRTYEGSSVYELMFAAMSGPPVDPRERAPDRRIPDEIAEVCMQALALDRDERHPGAGALGEAVEAFLEGSKRRQAAALHVAGAERAWERHGALTAERAELEARRERLERRLEPWRALEEKRALLDVRDRLVELRHDRIDAFEEVVAECEQALSQDPDNDEARAVLARVHFARFEEAEATGDSEAQQHHRQRVRRYDDGTFAERLLGTGALSLRTDPPGALVLCQRFVRRGLIWQLTEQRVLGRTPLESAPLAMGSYLLTLGVPGRPEVRYPVFIPRGHRWDSGPTPVPLPRSIDEGFVYVPPGPCLRGGDPDAQDGREASRPWVHGFVIARFPVTMEEYCAFLNALNTERPEEAWTRVPRQESGLKGSGGQYWDRPAPGEAYVVPEVDRDGDRWDPRWAVVGVTWDDAITYAAWRSQRDGVEYALPTDLQWEKAARGVDGRLYPWGDHFDPSLCKMRESRAGSPKPEPVGAFPTDVSVYGVQDMAGGTRDWCGDLHFEGDASRRPARGGSWHAQAAHSRCAWRTGLPATFVGTRNGFRLTRVSSRRC